MSKLQGRRVNGYGDVIFDETGLDEVMMSGNSIAGLYVEDHHIFREFNQICAVWDYQHEMLTMYEPPSISPEECHKKRSDTWFMPAAYESIDVKDFLLGKCNTDIERERVLEEWNLFVEHDMIRVLQFLIYLVDHFKERGIIWGVGRGSSVASYCLYLIGIHRIDSIKYSLDIREFLR